MVKTLVQAVQNTPFAVRAGRLTTANTCCCSAAALLLLLLLCCYCCSAAIAAAAAVPKIQAPCWADGLACPSLRGLDPAKLARDLVSRSAASVASAGGKGGGVSVATVDEVFALVQLGLDDRCVLERKTDAMCRRLKRE